MRCSITRSLVDVLSDRAAEFRRAVPPTPGARAGRRTVARRTDGRRRGSRVYRPAPAAATASAVEPLVQGGQLVPRHAGSRVVGQVEVVVEEEQRHHRTGAHDRRLCAAVDECDARRTTAAARSTSRATRAPSEVHPHVSPQATTTARIAATPATWASDATSRCASGRARSADQAAPIVRTARTGGPSSMPAGERAQHRRARRDASDRTTPTPRPRRRSSRGRASGRSGARRGGGRGGSCGTSRTG